MQSLYGAIANTNKKEIMVLIDRVYQKVLALANKEQRGYITPLEFNLFADHAQMEIFEQYFYDLGQFKRRPGSTTEYSDPVNLIEEKLYHFKNNTALTNGMDLNSIPDFYMLSDVYRIATGSTYQTEGGYDKSIPVEELNHMDLLKTQNSPLTWATQSRPIYYIRNNNISFSPLPVAGESFGGYYFKSPTSPNWNYTIASGNPLHIPIPGVTQDFELHSSEENALVMKILQLAGVAIKDFNLAQIAGQKEANTIQQEKQ